MGVDLTSLVTPERIEFDHLRGKAIAIDAFNTLYQFLSIIRQPDGTPLMDSQGRITSHLSGILYRNANLIELGIKPVYVFDGKPPELKSETVANREKRREEAREKYEIALQEKRLEDARVYATQSARLTSDMVEEAKKLLELLGIPFVQAPGEGEAQAAYMAEKGDVFAAGSQDYDSLLFGAPRLVRNLTISGKRKLPRKNVYIEITPEIFHLNKLLEELEITREQLIDIAILIGTDYNPGGVEGIGPKRAYNLIKKYGSAEKAIEKENLKVDFDVNRIREIFLNKEVTSDYRLSWQAPDKEGVLKFLCDERDFSQDRVSKALERMEKAVKRTMKQSSLDAWF